MKYEITYSDSGEAIAATVKDGNSKMFFDINGDGVARLRELRPGEGNVSVWGYEVLSAMEGLADLPAVTGTRLIEESEL